MRTKIILSLCYVLLSLNVISAQKKQSKVSNPLDSLKLSGLKWRGIGPALTSGRIADLAVNPDNPFEYYVAVASGGVWKTDNAGLDYYPLFDKEGSYSIGCITMDPNNHNVIWVGTGENNNQRSVAYGDGVYKSVDGGKTWKNMGLKNSEHIGKIIVHPENSNIVYVAAIGPLWSKGGDRGLYKTMDGGETWEAVLTVNEHTGVNDVIMDPRNPEVLYAASHQRRRHVYTYVGGGPGSGMHKSTDGGKTWSKINKGLPSVEIGRIGLTISPANPEILFAIVEASEKKGGFFKSTNRGASWNKQSDWVTSGNYYQEIVADPVNPETIYSMDTWLHVSHDSGKTFEIVGEKFKHIDNHCMWINPANNKHWLVGCDGGIYETFDSGAHWDFKDNLPVTQFYKVAVDNDTPFYNIYGGTQDNYSMGGPSRVNNHHGITNQDWFITHGGDGFETQIDQSNPNIVYAQSQYGWLVRYDKQSGEEVGIKPVERAGEDTYRWNWDAPLISSIHGDGVVYFAANKVFRSTDYGNSWEVISEDLTRQLNRNELKVYDRVVSIDAVEKNASTSPYGTIVAMSESPLDKNLLAIGTDDGLIQITEDAGKTWRKIDNIPNAPNQSYVNAIYLSQHDANRIYVAFNHHKYGDFKPYIFQSNDKGKTWMQINSNLPERGSVYALEEDHEDTNLIFCGTEFGVYFSPDRGGVWKQLGSSLPTIAVRDIAIQRRENDLVLATFGRGFYVLDDYSVLRDIENEKTEKPTIYPIRDALVWEQSKPLGNASKGYLGDNFYTADNLGPEVIFTYYFHKDYESSKEKRQKGEKALIKETKDVSYPTYEALKNEVNEMTDQLVFLIKNDQGEIVRKLFEKPKKGLQRIFWDMRYDYKNPIKISKSGRENPFSSWMKGTLVLPGTYTIEMQMVQDNQVAQVVEPVTFKIKPLNNATLPIEDRTAKVVFQDEVNELAADVAEVQDKISDLENRLSHIKESIKLSSAPLEESMKKVLEFEKKLDAYNLELRGDAIKERLDIGQPVSISTRVSRILSEQKYTTSTPTLTHRKSFEIAQKQFEPLQDRVQQLYEVDIRALEDYIKNFGAPYTPGRLEQKD